MSVLSKKIFRGGIIFLFSSIVNKGYYFFLLLLITYYLTPHDLGLFILAQSLIQIINSVVSNGLVNTIVKLIPSETKKQKQQALFGTLLTLAMILYLASTAIIFLLADDISVKFFHETGLRGYMMLLLINSPFLIFNTLSRALLQALHKIRNLLYLDMAIRCLSLAITIIFLLYEQSLTAAIVSIIIANAAGGILYIIYLFSLKLRPSFSIYHFRPIIKDLSAFMVLNFFILAGKYTDNFLIGTLSSVTDVGLYALAGTFVMGMLIIHTSFTAVFLPIASAARDTETEALRSSFYFTSKLVSLINSVLLLVFISAGMTLITLFGKQYTGITTHHALILLGLSSFFGTWVGPSGSLLQMRGDQRTEIVNICCFIAVNLGLMLILIPRMGIVGAAVAALIANVMKNLLQVFQIKKYYGFWIIDASKIIHLAVTGVLSAIAFFLPDNLYISVIFIALSGCVLTGMYYYHLSASEKAMTHSLINNIRLKLRGNN